MRRIGVITTSRADYGIYRPVLHRIEAEPDLTAVLFVGGTHLSAADGRTIDEIETDGFRIQARVKSVPSADTTLGVAEAMGSATRGFARAFSKERPDLLLALGDRYEMHAAVVAALPFGIPVAHLHGGERTAGAMDDALRHSITKLSHLHFASTEEYAERIRQMGEEPWRVHVSGAPSLDNLRTLEPLDRDALKARLGMPLDPPPLLVTFHPVTLEAEDTESQVSALLEGLTATGRPMVFTYPNADRKNRTVRRALENFVGGQSNAVLVASLGTRAYFSLMRYVAAMVGNSSSGIIEAASFRLPVVDIGSRQQGRIRGRNVVHCGYTASEVKAAIDHVTGEAFRTRLDGLVNQYGDGRAAERIVAVLKEVELGGRLLRKGFVDLDRLATRVESVRQSRYDS